MDMADARDGASAVLLANGDTLIAGGSNSAGTLQTADIYQIDGSLTAAATMVTARSRHTATLLQDGRVLVAGGDSGGGAATNSAEIYDPGSDTWNSVGPLVSARFGHTATLLADGRVAIIAGESNGSPVAGIEVFDPNTGLFTQPASLNVARKDHAAALLADGRVLVAGGFGVDAQNNQIALSSVEIFDPVTNAVSAAANLNTARGRHSATVVLDGFVVVAGGSNGQADLSSIEIYTPGTDAWAVSAATLSVAREGHVATLLPKNNSVLISGGSSNGTALQSAELFRPWAGTVVSAGNLNATRVAGTGSPFGAEGLFLAAGGSGSKTTEFFRFATIKTDKADYAPGTPVLMSGTGYQPNEVVGLNLKQDDGDADINVSVQADAAGNISYQGFAPDPGDVGTHFHLTAVGQTSGFQAQTVFKDAQIFSVRFAGTGSGSVTGSGFSCTDTAGVATGTCDVGGFNNKNPINLTAVTGGSIGGWAVTAGDATVTSGCTSGSTTCNLQMGNQASTVTLTINKVSQSITFGALAGKIYGDADFTVSATASSGLAVSFSSQTAGVCTVSASTVHIVTAGTCTIRASQAGDANHLAAPNVDQSFTVAQKSITATVTANNKIYDATTTATQNTCSLSGVLPADSANVTCSAGTLSFADKNVGTAKAVSVSGISLSGTAAANYQLSSTTASASANITARPLTVTAITNTKIYDGGVTAAALPAITSGTLQGSDTASFTETYDTKNAGGSKTLTPSGTVNDGNSGNNYAYTFVNNTTGTITARALTITAAPNTKVYDGTTSAAALPTITTGALQGADTAGFVESYDTKHVGTAKTLTPSGTVNDGNSGNNYTYTFANNSAGVITARPLTVTASTNNKVYDGTASAASTPTITTGTLAAGDTATLTESYDNKNAGTGKSLVPAATIKDAGSANVTSDYNLTFANDTTGIITPRAITVTAASDSKIYDATTSSAGVPTISAPGIAPGDTAAFVQTFDTKNAGTGKILTPSGSVTDGNSGHNYAVTFANNSAGVITPRPLTVTAAANTKIYDGTISAAATPAITTGVLQGSDTAAFTETYDTKNAGTGKTLTPSGTASDGNSGNNYSYTFVNSFTGVISTRPITVTAASDSKIYDATTASAGVPTISAPGIAPGDTAAFVQTFDTKNAGTGKILTPSGSVTDGNSGHNYAVTFANNSAGIITPRPLTVTAAANTKVYDGTISAVATPAITTGVLQGTDSASFSESYDTKHVGTAKTLTPSGTVSDGNSGNNYAYTFVNSSTGVISTRPITVTAATDTKNYDGTTSSSATPTITGGSLATGDTASFTQVFDSRNAGARTLTASGSVSDGNSGNNYAVTFATASGTINKRAISVTAASDTKIYDSTTNSSATPAVGAPGIASGDTAAFIQTFDNKNAGTGKTLTPSGAVSDGNGGNNYAVTFLVSATGVISARPITVTASANTKIYDGNTGAAASPLITSGTLQGPDTASFTEAYDTKNAGSGKTLTPAGTVNDGNGGSNYNVTFAAVNTGVVNKRSLTVSASADNKIYDGNANATAHLTDDRVTGDALTDAYASAAFTDKNVGTAKAVNVTGINVTGADSGNYTFNSSASTTASITPRDLTVTATADNKIYDRTTNAVAHLADNRISGDILTASYTTAAFADRNVGNGKTVTVSGISISGVDAGNYNLTNAVASALANITARTVTPVVAANNKVYDRLTTATLSSQSVSGSIAPDVVGLTVTGAAFDTKNAGSGKTVTATGLSLNGADAGNYSLNGVNSATTTADILQRPLNVTAAGVDRIYDGTTGATVTLSDDRIAGDVLTDTYATASFANKNVGNNKAVSVSGIAISGLDAGNYSLNNTTASTTANISPRTLTVSATGVSKVYDGTTAAAVTLADDRIAGDLLTDSYASAAFADKSVANEKPISVSGISISGVDAGNYTFNSAASTSANITPRPLHISATGVSRVYDGTTVATVSLADDRVSGDAFSDSYTSASFADKNAANAKPVSVIGIAISGPDAGNYSANTSAATTADITPRPITVSATSDTKVYDATTSSIHTPGITTGSVAAGDSAAFTQAFDSKNAGARTLIASGTVNDGNGGNNYSISFATAAGSITQRPLTVTATATGKIYDGTTTASVTLSDNHLGGDSVSDAYASAAFSDKNVGTGKLVSVTGISLSGADSGNYSLTSMTASTTADITARTLTVSAHGIDKPYDGGTAATVTLSDDRVSGDLVTDSYSTASFADKNVGAGKPVSVSGISISGGDAANYALASTSATTSAAINARGLTVSAAGIGKIYDGTTTGSVTLSDNRVAGDTFNDSYVAASFSDRNAGTTKAIAVSGISISGLDAGNYSLANTTATASADISPLGLTIAAVTDSKVYDGTIASAGIPHVTPALVSGDSGIFSQTFNNKNVGNSKLLVPAASITDGNGGNNYAVTLINNSTGVITPRGLAVSASATDKVYDGTTSASVSLTDNRLSGDSFNINFAGANFTDQNAGLGKTVTVSGISLSGPDAGNYTPNTSATATASILQRPITVTADSKTRIFGTPDPALTYQITSGSLVSGDSFTGSLTRVAGSTVGSYAISQGTLALSSNYLLSFIGSSFTIMPAATTITLNPAANVTLGQATLPVSAIVHAVLPSTASVNEGSVTFTLLQGSSIVASTASATVSGGGASANLAVSALPVGSYTVQATFNPPITGANFTGSSSTTGVSAGVQYNICLLYDGTRSVKSGATYPVKIYLCDINNRDVSASGIIIHATSASMLSGWSGPPEDAGNSNPDLDFRYDSTLGPSGGYIFNLKTTGLGSGTYSLNFSAAGDPASHSVPFGVK
jgi:hypothetical protein